MAAQFCALSTCQPSPFNPLLPLFPSLLFYPTTDPSHKPLNCVKLASRAVCMEYVKEMGEQKPRVMIGHCKSTISIYHMDECKSRGRGMGDTSWLTLTKFFRYLWYRTEKYYKIFSLVNSFMPVCKICSAL